MTVSTHAQRISLDRGWLFTIDSTKSGIAAKWFAESADRSTWKAVEVPKFWEGYPGMANYDGWGWFATRFSVAQVSEPMSVVFNGVDDDAVVWVNGVEVGSHEGYSDAFAVELNKTLRVGENLLVVLVKDYGGGGGIYKPITLIQSSRTDELLRSEYYGTPAVKSAEWVKKACIYSVYLRSFSKEGTFAGLEKRILELKELGATVLWLMPIHPVGVKNRKGTLGSPYAVRDYYDVNPEFGTMADFKKLLATVHKHGMKLIIDLVANHTSWDSKLIVEHPEWFTKDAKGTIIAPNADWTDVADLDYSHKGLRTYMSNMMVWWVREVGIDGFRCDVAELVPTDFWNDVRKRLNRIKPVMMLSEGSLPEHHVKAFDVTYSWNVYDALDLLLQGKRPVTLLDDILKKESLQFPIGALRMRFTTNHDKNAWDAPAVEKFGLDGLTLATILVNTLPGVPLIYTGEEVANDKKLGLFEKVDVDWTRPRDVGEVYQKLFQFRKENKALAHGTMVRLKTRYDKEVYAFARVAGKDFAIVVLNFSSEGKFTPVEIPLKKLFGSDQPVQLRELFDGQLVEVAKETVEQVVVALEPRAYKVFVPR